LKEARIVKDRKSWISRRDFLRRGARIAAGGLAGLSLAGISRGEAAEKSRVVLVRDPKVQDGQGRIRPVPLREMLDRAVAALLDAPDPSIAWKRLVSPADVVGVKTNVWSYLPTPDPLNAILRERLAGAGVREENISVDDRGVLDNPVFRRSTALINVRPMRTHHWAGLGSLLKNYIMFVPDPSNYHENACERLGSIWHLPHVKGKTRLNILVMITPLFHGTGPHHFSPRYTWPYCGLIVSRDPVAADATGARIIQAKRNAHFGEDRPISPNPRHIVLADTLYRLGRSRPEEVEIVRLGWTEDSLLQGIG
jgi:citrate lyase gamma subunit